MSSRRLEWPIRSQAASHSDQGHTERDSISNAWLYSVVMSFRVPVTLLVLGKINMDLPFRSTSNVVLIVRLRLTRSSEIFAFVSDAVRKDRLSLVETGHPRFEKDQALGQKRIDNIEVEERRRLLWSPRKI